MRRINGNKRKNELILFLVGIFIFQAFIVALIFLNVNSNVRNTVDNTEDENNIIEMIYNSEGTLPNLTRTGYPLILNNASATELWTALHGRHINNIRIAYYSLDNEWVLIPFQLDEMAYFRTYTYEIGYQADASLSFLSPRVDDADLACWGHTDVEHRYAGMHINSTPGSPYEEPTKYECEMSYWWERQKENYVGGDTPPDPPQHDPAEDPGGPKEQLPHRLDWDDELVFYAENGKKASRYSWWNYDEYPQRYCIKITDPVDGGQSWMYIYYNDKDMNNPPDINYYIPPGGKDYVSWDKTNLKITGQTYELQLDPNNLDLDDSLRIKWPGLTPNDLYTSSNKQYISVWFRVYFSQSGATIDVNSDSEVWREGQWDEGYYDEQLTDIGYGLQMDFGWDDGGSDWSGHRTYTDPGVSSSIQHTLPDDGDSVLGITVSEPDAADHDGDTSEITPHLRGLLTPGQKNGITPNMPTYMCSHEAAVDGPVRVILDRISIQYVFVSMASPIEWEELWTITTKRSKYYANMMQDDPYALDVDMNEPGSDLQLTIHPHYAFMYVQRLSDFVRNDPNSYILLGAAPNDPNDGLPDFSLQADPGLKSWPLYLYPDGAQNGPKGNDGVLSGGNPIEGHYDDTHLLPGSGRGLGSNPPANNPLSDWRYLYTSSGGAWSYIPYQESWQLFSTQPNRDLATYWKDTSDPGGYSEIGLYGNDGDDNGATGEYILRTVFGNFSYWECLREYARTKYQLNDNLHITYEVPPPQGAPIFEDTDLLTGYWYDDGDTIEIIIDLEGAYNPATEITADFSQISTNPSYTVTEIDSILHRYKITHVISASTIPDRTPPLSGYLINITVTNMSAASKPTSWHTEEVYLDKTDPSPPSTVTATQDGATVVVDWSGASDNGKIDYYEVWRAVDSGSYSFMIKIDASLNTWTDDNNILNGHNYSYFIRTVDMVGRYADSNNAWVVVDLNFDPAEPDPLPAYFTNTITINWTNNPGDTSVIDNYRIHYAHKASESPPPSSDDYSAASGYLSSSTRTYEFTPSDGNGYYFFKVESYDSGGGGSILSGEVYSLYDVEKPIPGVIQDIPDDYYPEFAEIHVHWSSEFDAWSGIDKFELYRQDNGGGYVYIDTFDATQHDYYDTNLIDGHTYDYYIRTYDKAGNYDDTSIESVTYHAPSNPPANLKLSRVNIIPTAVERNTNFIVYVNVSNTGGQAGTVNDINLKFNLPGTGDISYNFTWTDPTFGSVPAYTTIMFTFTAVHSNAQTAQGEITVDATMTWDTSNTDDGADVTDTFWLRDFNVVNIKVVAPSVVEHNSVNNPIYMTIINKMVTSINITNYYLTFPGWTEGTDYTISDNGDQVIPDGIISGGSSAMITFTVDIAGGAPVGNDMPINAYVEGVEIVTGNDISNSSTPVTTWDVFAPDSTPPVVSNVGASPDPGDPEAGDILTIYATVTDSSGVSSVTAYIEHPDETIIQTLTLYDDGTHGDPTAGDNNYTNTWDCSGYAVGTYYIDIRAVDASPSSNTRNSDNAGTFSLQDLTAPTVDTVQALPDPLELESTITITAQVNDFSGISTVTAYVQHPDGTNIETLTLYDDGTHGDSSAGDNTYTNQWTSTSSNALGTYYVDIRAIDSSPASNQRNVDNADTFTLQDTTAPTLSSASITPTSGQPNQVFIINIDASDPSGITSVWAEIEHPNNVVVARIQLYDDGSHNDGASGDGTYGNSWDSTGYGEGLFYVNINATDGSTVPSPNTAWVYNVSSYINITDTIAPTISNVLITPSTGDPEQGTVFTITADVSDISGILSVWATIEDGSFVAAVELKDDGTNGDVTPSDGTYTGQWDSSGTPEGNYNVDVNATDNSNSQNVGYVDNGDTFQLIDATAPIIHSVFVSPSNGDPEAGTIITITVNVTDLSGLSTVTAYIESPDETVIDTVSLTLNVNGNYTGTWDSTGHSVGTYYVDITAVDNSAAGNTRNINNGDTFTLADNTDPTIGSVSANPASLELGNVLVISAVVTDFSGITNVWATIEDGSWVAGVQLYDDGTHGDATAGDNNYTGTWDSSGYSTGSYNIDINATDNSAAQNTATSDNADSFTIVDTTNPSIQNGAVNPTSGTVGTNFTITATITDESSISQAWATIENGTFIAAVQLYDDGSHGDATPNDNIYTGVWDSTGWYASTYNVDINATDNNGRTNKVDNVASISLTSQDTTPPQITNVQANPSIVNPGDIIVISCEIFDDSGIYTPNVTIYNATYKVVYDLVFQGGNTWSYNWDTTDRLGTYFISINATDKSTNNLESFAENVTSVLVTNADIKNPSVTQIVDMPNQQVGYVFDIYCVVTDDKGVSKVYAYIQNPDGNTIATVELAYSGTNNNYTGTWDSTGFAIGTYYLDIFANDTSNNINYTDNADSFTLSDNNAPTLLDSHINSTNLEYGQILFIEINVSDPSGIAHVYADIQETDGNTVATIELFLNANNNYSNTWNSLGYNLNASYYIDIRAIDASSNSNQGTWNNQESFNLRDTTAPSISNPQISTTPLELGDSLLINCTVSDLLGVSEVWATLKVGGSFVTAIRLYDDGLHGDKLNGDGIYANSWDSTGYNTGTYTVDINATDISNNPSPNTAQNNGFATFNLEDTTNPSISNGQINPDTGEPNSVFTITANVYDIAGIQEVWATIESPNENFYTAIQLNDNGNNGDSVAGDGIYTCQWDSTGAPEGWYYVDINATDNNGLSSEITDIDNNIYIGDTQAPTVSNVRMDPSNGDPESGTLFTISCVVTDPSGISSVIAYIEFPDETVIATIILTDPDTDNNYTGIWNCIGQAEGTYWLDINATDNSLARNSRLLDNQDSATIADTTLPQINEVNISPNSGDPEQGTVFTITVNATDFSNISSVVIFIEHPDETVIISLTLYDDGTHGDVLAGDNIFTNTWDSSGAQEGTYFVDVRVTDNSIAHNVRSQNNAKTFTLTDNTDPTITNANITPLQGEVTQVFTITADISDMFGINTAYATITDASTGNWIAGIILYDDGSHGDGIGGDGTYGNTWDSTGYSVGYYNISINATDGSTTGNTAYLNNFATIQLTPPVPQLTVVPIYLTEFAYIGRDKITLIFNLSVAKADINITNIWIKFGASGEYSSLFSFDAINISLTNGYILHVSDGQISIEINYTISNSAQTTEDIQPCYVIIQYKDLSDFSYPDSETLITTLNYINIFETPKVKNIWISGVSTGGYVSSGNQGTITFYANATHYSGTYNYNVKLNMTIFGLGIVDMIWSITNYYYTIPIELSSGLYDLSKVSVNVSINIPNAGYEENITYYPGPNDPANIIVDADEPLINSYVIDTDKDSEGKYIIDINSVEEKGFYIYVYSKDNETSGVFSGISYVSIEITNTQKWYNLSLMEIATGKYGILISPDLIGDEHFVFYMDYDVTIEISRIRVVDKAGNENEMNIDQSVYLIDKTPLNLKEIKITINGNEISKDIELRAGEYLSLYIEIPYDNVGNTPIRWVRLYYKVKGVEISTQAEENKEGDYYWIEMSALDKGYFAVLSISGQVGFKEGQELSFYIAVKDYSGNIAKSNEIKATFKEELPIISYIVLGMAFVCFFGTIVYLIGFRRTGAKIIPFEEKLPSKMKK
ncbi:MAG: choice-of-anchor X domain-containing protein [Promethearchaeota archaeon]